MSISARAAGPEMLGRVTENGNVVGEFTVGGTLALVIFVGLLGGVIGSLGLVASDPWLRWMGPLRGVGFGVVALTVYGYDTFASVDFLILDPVTLNVIMFIALFIGFGVGAVGFEKLLDRMLPVASTEQQVGWLLVVAMGVMPLALTTLFFTSASFCGCEPAYEIGAALLIMVVATVVFHASKATTMIPAWGMRIAAVAGYLSLASAVFFGAARLIEELQRLL